MTPTIQVGTILIGDRSPRMASALELESTPYLSNWSVLTGGDSFALDDKIRAAGWTFFFMAEEVKAMFFGRIGAAKVREALGRILSKVRPQNFNCLEVTAIVPRSFLGLPYATVFAHSRHIQQSRQLDSAESRRNERQDAEWARN
jgi:hypothetical protein